MLGTIIGLTALIGYFYKERCDQSLEANLSSVDTAPQTFTFEDLHIDKLLPENSFGPMELAAVEKNPGFAKLRAQYYEDKKPQQEIQKPTREEGQGLNNNNDSKCN